MDLMASNSVAVLPATSRDNGPHVLKGGLFRHLTDCWLRHFPENVERDVRWLGHDGVLADFARASHG